MTTTRNNLIRRTIAVFMAVLMVFGLLTAFGTTVYASERAYLEHMIANGQIRIRVAQTAIDNAQGRYDNAISDTQRRAAIRTIDFQTNVIAEETARIADFEIRLAGLNNANTTPNVNTNTNQNNTTENVTSNQNNTNNQTNTNDSHLYRNGFRAEDAFLENILKRPPDVNNPYFVKWNNNNIPTSENIEDFIYDPISGNFTDPATGQNIHIHVPQPTDNSITLYQTERWSTFGFDRTGNVYGQREFYSQFNRLTANGTTFIFEGRHYAFSDFFNTYTGLAFDWVGVSGMPNTIQVTLAQDEVELLHPNPHNLVIPTGSPMTPAIRQELIEFQLSEEFAEAVRVEFYRLVNEHRDNNGLVPFVRNRELEAVADIRAAELRVKFSHFRPNGLAWHSIGCYEEGWDNRWGGENIISGFPMSPDPYRVAYGTFRTWQNSPGHNALFLGDFRPHSGRLQGMALGVDFQSRTDDGRVNSPGVFLAN